MNKIAAAGLFIGALSLISMVLGHLGNHDFGWQVTPISTFAKKAPYDFMITTSMYLSMVSFVCISLLVSKYRVFGDGIFRHTIPVLIGATITGLCLLAAFEETVTDPSAFTGPAMRIQAVHDVGEKIFFCGCLLLTTTFGCLYFLLGTTLRQKASGVLVAGVTPLTLTATDRPLCYLIGGCDLNCGVRQRVTYFSVWLAIMIVFLLTLRTSPRSAKP